MVHLCADCILTGYCQKQVAYEVTDKEMTPQFVQDGRNLAVEITKEEGLTAGYWPHSLHNKYAAYPGRILNRRTGLEAKLDLEVLFRPKHVSPEQWEDWYNLDSMVPENVELDYRTWYRDNLMVPCGPNPHTHYVDRLRAVFTLLRAVYPERARHWGLRPQNDNP